MKIMDQAISKIIARQAVKGYSEQKIKQEDWVQIREAIKWAPSSLGFEPYRVLVISKSSPLRQELKPVMWNQEIITSADKLVLFLTIDYTTYSSYDWLYKRALRRMKITGKLNSKEIITSADKYAKNIGQHLANFESKTNDWPKKQAYIALGMGLAASALLGIGSTPLEGFEPPKVKEILLKHKLIEPNEVVGVALCLGYPKNQKAYGHQGSNVRIRDNDADKFTEI